jgi:hypothetical protein
MLRIKGTLGTLVLSAAMLAPLLTSGCAAHARYYDEYHADYHPWNDGEVRGRETLRVPRLQPVEQGPAARLLELAARPSW